jgi:hypothetical protein
MKVKPRFKMKWKSLVLTHTGKEHQPFPGKSPTRWAIVQWDGTGKLVCLYEGKPSVQALEIIFTGIARWIEFDRQGVFFVQDLDGAGYGNVGRSGHVAKTWLHYHPNMSPDLYVQHFRRP